MNKNINMMVLLVLLSGCANLVTNFDQNTFDSATELKPLALSVISKATEPADKFKGDIDYLQQRLDAQLAYETGKDHNEAVAKQWDILVSPEHNLLGGFIKDWRGGKTFSPAYITEKQKQIGEGFNQILSLEGKKTK